MTIEAAVEGVAELVRADGADIVLHSWDEGSGMLALALVLVEDGCAECVMPKSFLEEIALSVAQRVHSPVRQVIVHDPRGA